MTIKELEEKIEEKDCEIKMLQLRLQNAMTFIEIRNKQENDKYEKLLKEGLCPEK